MMSLDKEKPEKISVNLKGSPSQHLIRYRDRYYKVSGHSPEQAKLILALKTRRAMGDKWKGVKAEMKEMKSE